MTRNPISAGSPWEASLTSLAILRIWTAVVVLGAADVWHAPLQIPRSVDVHLFAGPGGALLGVLPRTPVFLHAVLALTVLAAVATAAGLVTRVATALLAVGLFVLLGLAQLGPTPIHNHHLFWFATLLAASPCGETLSLDAWLRARRQRAAGCAQARPAPSAAAGLTLWFASALLAAVYFFPGLHKAFDGGTPFFDSDALQRLLRLKAFEAGESVPSVLADHPQRVLWCAVAVVVVEVCFVGLALTTRWRRVCVLVMLALHAGLALSVFIGFSVLAAFAVVFALPVRRTTASASTRGVVTAGVVGVLLLAGVAFAGTQGRMRGFPFACYPTFSTPVPFVVPDLEVAARIEGSWRVLPRDVVAPPDIRTAVLGAARRVQTAAQARAFVAARMRDLRFAEPARAAGALIISRRVMGLAGPVPHEESRAILFEGEINDFVRPSARVD